MIHNLSSRKCISQNFQFHITAIEKEDVAHIYWMAEQKCRRTIDYLIRYMIFERSAYVFALLFAIYCVYVGNFDTSTYYLPLRLAPPFNINSIFVWLIFWAFQFICGIAYLCGTVIVTMYFVSCYFYLEAFCKHFDYLIELVDAALNQNHHESNDTHTITYQSPLNARKILINAIDQHNKIYE